MAKLHVRVDTVPIPNDPQNRHQTRSKFGKSKDTDAIIFSNKDTQSSLKIDITSDPANGPVLCQEKDNKTPIALPATVGVNAEGKYTICRDFKGAEFKYTATIGTALAEDPIIIIEKKSFSVGVVGIVVAAAVGATIGAAVANYFATRRRSLPGT
jgi:hypothetical protein